jgi:RNA polymerase sigma factor (sigma-70 family)
VAVRNLDIELLKKLDAQEWERLQAEYHDRVFGYVKRQVGDAELAADLTQDTFLGAVRGIRNFNTRYNVEQFLMGIARNKVIDHLRRKRPEIHVPDRDDDSTGFFGTVPSDSPSSHKLLEGREKILRQKGALVICLRDLVAELWEKRDFHRLMAIELCFLTDWKHRKIADRLKIEDEKAIAGIKFRAIRDLQTRLRRRDPRKTLFSGLWEAL